MAIINFGKLDKNQISILVGCVFCFLNRILNQYDGTLLFKNTILTNIFIQFSRIFNIIPYLIFKKRSKKVINNDTQNTDHHKKYTLLFQDLNTFYESNYKYIFLSAIIFFLESIMFAYTLEIKSSSWLLYLLFASLLYYLILKIKLYKHH